MLSQQLRQSIYLIAFFSNDIFAIVLSMILDIILFPFLIIHSTSSMVIVR